MRLSKPVLTKPNKIVKLFHKSDNVTLSRGTPSPVFKSFMGKRVLLATDGTRGDTQPVLAVAKSLHRLGYDITFVANTCFSSFAAANGIENFIGLHAEDDQFLNRILDSLIDRYSVEDLTEFVQDELQIVFPRMSSFFTKLFQTHQFDAVIFSPVIAIYIYPLCKARNLLAISLALQPLLPTNELPPIILEPPADVTDFKPMYEQMNSQFWGQCKQYILPWLAEVLPQYDPNGVLFNDLYHDEAVQWLNCYSPNVMPQPSDYISTAKTIGYLWLDHEPTYKPPKELENFLSHDTAPLYFGFGSMKFPDPEAFTTLIVDTVRELNVRAILCEGWGSLRKPQNWDETSKNNKNILFISDVPHSFLFPKCSAAIIHGGAGTTAAAFRAGIPVQIIPFLADQPFWAKRSVDLGVGLPGIGCNSLTREHLLGFVPRLLNDSSLRDTAKQLAVLIAAENPFTEILALLEK